jgi:uncharacterized protein YgbK (DUF1537 family)
VLAGITHPVNGVIDVLKTPNNRLVIVADDLTGAMDSSGYLAGMGLSVIVYLGPAFEPTTGVTVVNTDSRSDLPTVAATKLREVSRRLKGATVFKKIDSTLRGNIATEIIVMLEILSYEMVIVTPAFPAMGRTVENGVLRVKGVPVAETDFGQDAVSPVKESSVPALFERYGCKVGTVMLEDVEKGPEHLSGVFAARTERILVCDAVEQAHLRHIVQAAAKWRHRILLVGSGGLAREIRILLDDCSGNRFTPDNCDPGPALLVVGSRHPASAAQLLRAQNDLDLSLLKIDIMGIEGVGGKSRETARLAREAGVFLEKGKSVALTSAFSPFAPGQAKDVAAALAEAVGAVLIAHRIPGLFLSGGDTAMAVCERLGVTAIRVYGEIQPGIPAGKIKIGQSGVRLVTKAGGFGGETAIVESMPYLERGTL